MKQRAVHFSVLASLWRELPSCNDNDGLGGVIGVPDTIPI
jgi:hypothetical protein